MNWMIEKLENSPRRRMAWLLRSGAEGRRRTQVNRIFDSCGALIALLLIALSLCSRPIHGQAGAANGAISGTVFDSAKHVVPGAQITATNRDTGFSRSATSDDGGNYSLPLLPLGTYSVSVDKAGFSRLIQSGLTIEPERSTPLSLVLSVASGAETVQVTADAVAISTESQAEFYVPQLTVQNMPLTSRNLWNIPSFSPGVTTTPNQSFGSPAFAFGGLERRGYVVDGMDDTQRAGLSKLGDVSVGCHGGSQRIAGITSGGVRFKPRRTGVSDEPERHECLPRQRHGP